LGRLAIGPSSVARQAQLSYWRKLRGKRHFPTCRKNDFIPTSSQKRFYTKNDFGAKTIFCQEEQFWPLDTSGKTREHLDQSVKILRVA
jgi:hypothetical protein